MTGPPSVRDKSMKRLGLFVRKLLILENGPIKKSASARSISNSIFSATKAKIKKRKYKPSLVPPSLAVKKESDP